MWLGFAILELFYFIIFIHDMIILGYITQLKKYKTISHIYGDLTHLFYSHSS